MLAVPDGAEESWFGFFERHIDRRTCSGIDPFGQQPFYSQHSYCDQGILPTGYGYARVATRIRGSCIDKPESEIAASSKLQAITCCCCKVPLLLLCLGSAKSVHLLYWVFVGKSSTGLYWSSTSVMHNEASSDFNSKSCPVPVNVVQCL